MKLTYIPIAIDIVIAEGNIFVNNSKHNIIMVGKGIFNFIRARRAINIPKKAIINKYIISFNLSLFFLPKSLLSSRKRILLINFPFSVSNPTPITNPIASFFD